jgi:hypothetical protein
MYNRHYCQVYEHHIQDLEVVELLLDKHFPVKVLYNCQGHDFQFYHSSHSCDHPSFDVQD